MLAQAPARAGAAPGEPAQAALAGEVARGEPGQREERAVAQLEAVVHQEAEPHRVAAVGAPFGEEARRPGVPAGRLRSITPSAT